MHTMQDKELRFLFVINPASGGKNREDWETLIRHYFQEKPFSTEFFVLGEGSAEESIRHWIEQFKPDRVVAVGGDGTISMVAKLLGGTEMALGILPAGSANGMARELNIPLNAANALDLLVDGEIKNADVIEINEKSICLHLSDIGMNAKLIKYFEEGKLRGKWGYARVLLKVFMNKTPMLVKIHSKEHQLIRKAFMVVLANASKYGTGAVINPTGNLYDGLFEVVIIRRLALSEILKSIFRSRAFNPKKFEVIQADSVTVNTKHPMHFQIDGEYLGKVNSVTAKILKGYLRIIVPKPEDESQSR